MKGITMFKKNATATTASTNVETGDQRRAAIKNAILKDMKKAMFIKVGVTAAVAVAAVAVLKFVEAADDASDED